MPLPRRRMGLSSDEERALSQGAKAGAFFLGRTYPTAANSHQGRGDLHPVRGPRLRHSDTGKLARRENAGRVALACSAR